MAENLENSIFDDQEAVKYIQANLPQEAKGKFTDDEVLYISDLVYEYYEVNGFLEEEDEVEIDVEDLTEYVIRALKKDAEFHQAHPKIDPELVEWVVRCEMDYEDTLG